MNNILISDKRTFKDALPFLVSGFVALIMTRTMMNNYLNSALFLLLLYYLTLFFMGRKGLELGYLVMVFTLPLVLFIPSSIIGDRYYHQINYRFALYLGMLPLWGALLIRKKISLDLVNNKVVFLLLFFLLMETVSLSLFRGINIPDFRDSFAFQDIRDQCMSLIFFLLTISLCKSKSFIETTLYVVAASAPIVIGFGFYEKLTDHPLFFPAPSLLQEFTRVTSTFRDPNHLSRYLVILILLYLPVYLFRASSGVWRLMVSLSALLLLPLTGSVSGAISLLIGAIIIFFKRRICYQAVEGSSSARADGLFRGLLWFALILLFLVFGSWFYSQFSIYFEIVLGKLSIFEGSARQNMDLAALQMFANHPLFGVGFSNYSILFSSFNPGHNLWYYGGTPIIHNSFMSVASELGIAGLIPLLLIYISFAKIALMDGMDIRDNFLRVTQISLGATWIALIVNSFVYFKFFEDPKVWFVAGLIIAINRVTAAGKHENAQ